VLFQAPRTTIRQAFRPTGTALFWSAVINGVVAVPLLIAIVLIASDARIMGRWVSSGIAKSWGWATVLIMGLAAIGMFAFM
jgi:Mn2+/Fe2+ NRAMP family transporter